MNLRLYVSVNEVSCSSQVLDTDGPNSRIKTCVNTKEWSRHYIDNIGKQISKQTENFSYITSYIETLISDFFATCGCLKKSPSIGERNGKACHA